MAICIFKLLNLFAEISILYLDSWRLVRVWLWRHTPPFGHHLWSTVHVLFALQLFLFRSLFAGRLLFIYIFHPDTAIQSIHLEIYHGHQNTTNERTRIHDVSSFRRFVNHQTITIMFTRNTTKKKQRTTHSRCWYHSLHVVIFKLKPKNKTKNNQIYRQL